VDEAELIRAWRRADEPVAGHDLAVALLAPDRYERTRGVAQQAARAARLQRVDRAARRRLLSAAWLHDTGPAGGGWESSLAVARTLRRAGQEPLARIVAHCRNTPMAAALADRPPVVAEFPRPRAGDATVLLLLDLALLTTRADGVPGTPRDALRDRAEVLGPGDPGVRALVALVARLADDPAARDIAEALGRRAA
jgi:hypothetical protein